MRKKIFALVMCLLVMCSCVAFAAGHDYENSHSWVDIEDYAELFNNEEDILKVAEYVAEYTNVLVYTTNDNPSSTSGLCKSLAQDRFGTGNGVIFMIDMDNRYVYVYGHNNTYDIINERVGDTITDNVYDYASDERYDQCAKEALSQIYAKLSGKRIPEPMRYIGNAFLAIMIGIGVTVILACYSSRIQVSGQTVKDVNVKLTDKQRDIIDTKRVYRSSSSSGGGGGGSRSSGGGGGGGGRGGGGGHRF